MLKGAGAQLGEVGEVGTTESVDIIPMMMSDVFSEREPPSIEHGDVRRTAASGEVDETRPAERSKGAKRADESGGCWVTKRMKT